MNKATVTNVGAEADDVVFGLSATIAAAVAYLLPFGIIFLLIEDDNEFVRYNTAQSVPTPSDCPAVCPNPGSARCQGTSYLPDSWLMSVFSGLAIFVLVMGFNLLR